MLHNEYSVQAGRNVHDLRTFPRHKVVMACNGIILHGRIRGSLRGLGVEPFMNTLAEYERQGLVVLCETHGLWYITTCPESEHNPTQERG